MAGTMTQFDEFLAEEVRRYKGNSFPLKSTLPRRLLVRQVPIDQLHPNPEDEFCIAGIGPNGGIISQYIETFRHNLAIGMPYSEDPIIVERIHPSGYMILNGHHRWAAAKRLGIKKMKVRIVNAMQEKDLVRMMKRARNDKRVTLDLDEVVFAGEGMPAEKALPFPLNQVYREPLRRGIPALFYFLDQHGYDIWVYSEHYYSMGYIERYFRLRHVRVVGVVTGYRGKTQAGKKLKKKMDDLITQQYKETVHIDNDTVVRIRHDTKAFDDFPVENREGWSGNVVAVFEAMEKGRETSSVTAFGRATFPRGEGNG